MKIKLGLIASMVMGLMAFGGAAVSAHTWHNSLSCDDGQPVLRTNNTQYATHQGPDNFITIVLDGQTIVDNVEFDGSYVESFPAGSPYESHTATITVTAWDNDRWSYVETVTSGPCQERPYEPTASSSLRCADHTTTLSLEAQGFNPNWTSNAQWIIDGGSQVDHYFTGTFVGARTLNAYKPHTVTFRVWYKAGEGDKVVVYEKTRTVAACRERIVYAPKARFSGPYCDPMYIATFDNRGSSRAVTFVWYRTSHGVAKKLTRTVAAGKTFRTAMKHVDGRTITKIRARGETLISIRAAKGGNYPAPKGDRC